MFGPPFAFEKERTGFAVALYRAFGEDFEDAPFEEFALLVIAAVNEALHHSEGSVHGAERFDDAGHENVAALRGACNELRRLPNFGGKEFDFIAAEFLDALTTNRLFGLGENFDGGAVDESDGATGGATIEEIAKLIAFDDLAEVGVHPG